MNIGGLHIFGGLFFLLLCLLITFCYVVIIYLAIVLVRCLIDQEPEYWSNVKKESLFKCFAVIALLLSVLYVVQRVSWMGKDNTYYAAKEYFVAGEVVAGHTRLLGMLFHPERLVIQPYAHLQKQIYNLGIRQLPIDDGEKYVWYNRWFLSAYSHSDDMRPLGVGNEKLEPKMVELLDSYWTVLNGMMDNQIADYQMYKEYLLQFPFTVDYYSTFQGHYTGPFKMHGVRTRNNLIYKERNKQLLNWLDILSSKWEEASLIDIIWQEYPFVAAIRQYSLNELTQRISLSLTLAGEFSCDHLMIIRMKKEFEVSMSHDPLINPFLNLKSTNVNQAIFSYQMAVYSGTGQAGNYLLTHICKEKLPDESYFIVDKTGVYNSFDPPGDVEHVFDTELKQFIK